MAATVARCITSLTSCSFVLRLEGPRLSCTLLYIVQQEGSNQEIEREREHPLDLPVNGDGSFSMSPKWEMSCYFAGNHVVT